MVKKDIKILIPQDVIVSKIYEIRGEKVMIDRDLAELYGVETRVLNQAVRRNLKRFPDDFMFQMTQAEMEDWKSQIVISNKEKMGLRKPPLVFTEQGVAMLSSVLNSDKAIEVNIQIVRVFTYIRQMLADNTDLRLEIEKIKGKLENHNKNIELVFQYLDELIEKQENPIPRTVVKGFELQKKKK